MSEYTHWGVIVAKTPRTEMTSKQHDAAKARAARLHSTAVGVNHEDLVSRVVHGVDADRKMRALRATGTNKRAMLRDAADQAFQAIEAGCKVNPSRIANLF